MNGYQSSTLALAGSVALVSLWHNQVLQSAWSVLSTNQNTGNVDLSSEVQMIGVDLVGVAILTFVAGLSDDAGKITIAIAVAAWLLFLMSSHKSNNTAPGIGAIKGALSGLAGKVKGS